MEEGSPDTASLFVDQPTSNCGDFIMGFDDTEVNGGDTSLAIGTESHGSDSRTTPAEKGVWKAGPVTIQLAGANVTR